MRIISKIKNLSKQKKQFFWFIFLWIVGFLSLTMISIIIKLIMGISIF